MITQMQMVMAQLMAVMHVQMMLLMMQMVMASVAMLIYVKALMIT